VKHIATKIVSAIASTDIRSAVEFVLNTDVADDSELAEGLFEIFEEHYRFRFSEISLGELARLLEKLEKVKSLHSHFLGYFLVHAGLRDPKAVARLLLSRLEQKIKLDRERWESPASEANVLGGQLVENFDALPEHGFYDERFQDVVNHPDYIAALRLIRDAALIEANRSTVQYDDTLSKLFREFSLNYGAVSLDVLDEWVNSGDCEKLQTALQLLGDTYLGFYVNNVPFVSNYLRRAQDYGRAVFEEVQAAMLHSAEFGPTGVMAAHSGEVAYALIDLGLKAVERAQGEPLAQNFFQQLCEKVERGSNRSHSDKQLRKFSFTLIEGRPLN
jgi:hypothetical protein